MKEKIKQSIIELLKCFLTALVIVVILINFIIMPVEVEGTSMFPTLIEGERGVSFIISRKIKLERFDIVVIKEEESDRLLVKRLIGMPNETIEYKDNVLYIDGIKYDEPYLNNVNTGDFNVELKDDEYYCLGDNRDVSRDSRSYGPFGSDKIVSNHVLVITPLNELGFRK